MMTRKLTWIPDVPDQRDYSFNQIIDQNLQTYTIKTTDLPPSVNLRKYCPEIEDQQTLGSCVSNSMVGLFEFNRIKSGMGGKNFKNFSRLFNYYNSRLLIDTISEDSGTDMRTAIKTAKLNGICLAEEWPYRLEYWKNEPPTKCYQSALNYRVKSYYRLNTLEEMKLSLYNKQPFIFGISVYRSFLTNNGIIPMPSITEKMLGGHAVMCIGYDDTTQMFLVRNSWGKNWGINDSNLKGYCWMPYAYLESRNLSDDFWTIL